MKKIAILMFLAICASVTSCKNTNDKNSETIENKESKTSQKPDNNIKSEKQIEDEFDINTIEISNTDLGDFPFFSLPNGMKEQNKPIKRSYDRLFFPINGVMTPIEGKIWKSSIVVPYKSEEPWSLPYFQKSYDDAIKTVGGVKIFDGKVSKEELDRIDEQASYFGEEGSIEYSNSPVRVYVIRRPNGDDIYVQLSGSSASGQLQILQKAPFKQTISMLKSDQIQKDLNKKGKVVLHINFDIDKATLKEEGKNAVAEISKALQSDTSLKININGYTDNTGNDAHNLQLSKDRALTVKNTIIASGIKENRLNSEGFGSKNPIADNSTEDGKAQNRRVELIKN